MEKENADESVTRENVALAA